jgi:hypothetical protein
MYSKKRTLVGTTVSILTICLIFGCKGQQPESTQSPPQVAVAPVPPPPSCAGLKLDARCFAFPADTPITVAGSSIDVLVSGTVSAPTPPNFTLTAKNAGQLKFDGVGGFPPSITLPGWIIRIANRDKASNTRTGLVKICSDRHCTGNALDAGNNVYFTLRGNVSVTATPVPGPPVQTKLIIHDNDCDGSTTCDFLVNVKLKSGATSEQTGPCSTNGVPGNCGIAIGTP